MATNPIIAEVRRLTANFETDQALEKLAAYLESAAPDQKAWLNTILQFRAQWEKAQQDERLGISDPADLQRAYNQVNHQLLEALTAIEAGRKPGGAGLAAPAAKGWLIGGGLLLAALLGLAVWYFTGGLQPVAPPVEEEPTVGECPVFADNSQFNVLILPFKSLRGEALEIHSVIKDRLALESERYRLPASVKVRAMDLAKEEYPSTGVEAAQLGEDCRAQLVIWGTTEAKQSGDIILTRFRFLNLGERFSLTKLQMNEAMEVDTLSSLSSIATEGLLTEDIEYNIKLLFGVIAHESANNHLAVQLLEGAEVKDSSASLLRGMIMADSYLALNDREKAVSSYNRVIEQHPNYSLARNNRAMLLYQQQQYEAAAVDLCTVVENNPKDANARALRASAYLKANRLDKAEEDIEQLSKQSSNLRSTNVRQLSQELDQRKTQLLNEKRRADQQLQQSPTNVAALEQKAITSRNLGDYREAARISEQLLQQDPDNVRATATLIEVYRELKDTAAAQEVLRRAQQLRVPQDALLKSAPALTPLLRRN